jgi:hypothetical protein
MKLVLGFVLTFFFALPLSAQTKNNFARNPVEYYVKFFAKDKQGFEKINDNYLHIKSEKDKVGGIIRLWRWYEGRDLLCFLPFANIEETSQAAPTFFYANAFSKEGELSDVTEGIMPWAKIEEIYADFERKIHVTAKEECRVEDGKVYVGRCERFLKLPVTGHYIEVGFKVNSGKFVKIFLLKPTIRGFIIDDVAGVEAFE